MHKTKILISLLFAFLLTGCQASLPSNYEYKGPISVGKSPNTLTYGVYFPKSAEDLKLSDYSTLIDQNDFLMWTATTSESLKPSTAGSGAPSEVATEFKSKLSGMSAMSPASKIGERYWVQFFTRKTTAWTAVYDLEKEQVVLLEMKG